MIRVLVSGGTGELGGAICRKFAEESASVFFTHRKNKREQAEQLRHELEAISRARSHRDVTHRAIELDLLHPVDGQSLRAIIKETGDDLSCLVNCAGMTRFVEHGNLSGLDDQLIDDILSTNVKAPIILIRELLPLLRLGQHSCIINITSVAARIANGSNIVYCASKSALDNVTRSLARALAPDLRVFSVAPGLIDTAFIRQFSREWCDEQVEKTPLKKLASLESVADAVFFAYHSMLESTGTTLEIDCGRPLA